MQYFRDLNVCTKLRIIVIFAVLFLLIVGGTGYYISQILNQDLNKMYDEQLMSVYSLNAASSNSRAVEALTVELILAPLDKHKQELKLQEIKERLEKIDALLTTYANTQLDSYEQERFGKLKEVIQDCRVDRQAVVNLAIAGKKDAAYQEYGNKVGYKLDAINSLLKELADYNEQQALQEKDNSQKRAATFLSVIIATTVVAIAFLAVVGRIFAHMIIEPVTALLSLVKQAAQGDLRIQAKPVNTKDELGLLETGFYRMIENLRSLVKHAAQTSEQVAETSGILADSADQCAQSASQAADTITQVAAVVDSQHDSIDEVTGVIEQVSTDVQQIVQNTTEMANTSEKTADAAKSGGQAMNMVENQMDNIEKTVVDSAQFVTKLGERSVEIDEIVNTISAIAGQTNLLALNAAIEAARAGEQGRGFAVVAEEIRKLAEQAEASADQIANRIIEIRQDTEQAVTAMKQGTEEVKIGSEVVRTAGSSFRQIVDLIDQVSQQVQATAVAIQDISSGTSKIVASVKAIDTASQNTASQTQAVSVATEEQTAVTQEIAASSESLRDMAEKLQQAIRQFKV